MSPQPSRRPVLLIFTLSGASGLIYQVIWARQLGLVFGNTTTSISIVLGAFMAGLALGAWWAGRSLLDRGNPLRLYALLEAAIGAFALLFGSLVAGMEWLYPALFSDETSVAALTGFRALACFGLLLVPTTMMGATLPLTTEYLHRLREAEHTTAEDWNAGRLYAANTLGAALGSLASGFILIELVGIRGSTWLAALFNFAVAAVGLVLARRLSDARTASAVEATAPKHGDRPLLALFAATGALALAAEVLWTRALSPLLGSSTYAFSAILIANLVGIALGSWMLSSAVRRLRRPEWLVPVAILLAGAWHLLAIALVPTLYALADRLFVDDQGGAWRLLLFVGAVLSLMIPPAFLSGTLFPAVTHRLGGELGDRGSPIARAYTWNTLGAIVGSLVAGFLIAPLFVQFHAVYVLAFGFFLLAPYALFVVGVGRERVPSLAVVALALLCVVLSARGLLRPDLFVELLLERRPDERVVRHLPGLQAITTVTESRDRSPESARLLVNGTGMTKKVFATKAMAHLPLAVHPQPEETLVVCMGMGTTFRSALAHGGNVEVVELVGAVTDVFEDFFADAPAVRANPRGRIIVNDARNHLLLTRKRYDVITIDPPPPIDAAGVNHLYSREFLELIRDHLKPGGLAAHWIPAIHPQNGVRDEATVAGLIGTFRSVFPHVRIFIGQQSMGLHLLGSMQPLDLEPARASEVYARDAVLRDLREFSWDPFDPRIMRLAPSLEPKGDRILTDDRPWLEFNLLENLRQGRVETMLRIEPRRAS